MFRVDSLKVAHGNVRLNREEHSAKVQCMSDWIEIKSSSDKNPKAKWLLVDESAFIRAQFKEVLNQFPIQLLEARDVVSAVELVQRYDDIALVICDVNLVRMNGASLIDQFSVRRESKIPLYILSAENNVELVSDSKKYGAVGWISKPPVAKELSAILKKSST